MFPCINILIFQSHSSHTFVVIAKVPNMNNYHPAKHKSGINSISHITITMDSTKLCPVCNKNTQPQTSDIAALQNYPHNLCAECIWSVGLFSDNRQTKKIRFEYSNLGIESYIHTPRSDKTSHQHVIEQFGYQTHGYLNNRLCFVSRANFGGYVISYFPCPFCDNQLKFHNNVLYRLCETCIEADNCKDIGDRAGGRRLEDENVKYYKFNPKFGTVAIAVRFKGENGDAVHALQYSNGFRYVAFK